MKSLDLEVSVHVTLPPWTISIRVSILEWIIFDCKFCRFGDKFLNDALDFDLCTSLSSKVVDADFRVKTGFVFVINSCFCFKVVLSVDWIEPVRLSLLNDILSAVFVDKLNDTCASYMINNFNFSKK